MNFVVSCINLLALRHSRMACTVTLTLPGYVAKALARFAPQSTSVARSPGIYTPPRYGNASQAPTIEDMSPALPQLKRTNLEAIIGVFLYYCLAVDLTGLTAVTSLASAQASATVLTFAAANRLLAYFRNYPANSLVLKACKIRSHIQ